MIAGAMWQATPFDPGRLTRGRDTLNQRVLFNNALVSTDNCKRDYAELKGRGVKFEGEPKVMPYGTGVLLHDLYGNKIYLNQDPI